jgi:acetyl-CoA carboxylase biotin carboxylase subunit
MISKLVAWAEDRPLAIARMRRALDEYLITGIKTTVPFFTWLLAQPDFRAGRFHTTYLDEALKARNGSPFVEASPGLEELAAIAAALEAVMSPSALASDSPGERLETPGARRWRAQARAEGLGSV